ncbi:MAG TPA: DNA primase regulatory subunit PriL [Methanoculleus sp.]|nr:DNA primase regulatory subunit PriL [Methanoculleus sp.]
MAVRLEPEDFAKYPFLEEAQDFVRARGYTLEKILTSSSGKIIATKAVDRIIAALSSKLRFDDTIKLESVEKEILSYSIARILVVCINNRTITEKLMHYESDRVRYFLHRELTDERGDPEKKRIIMEKIGITPDQEALPVNAYVELAAGLRDDAWRLVNRDIRNGMVRIHPEEIESIVREKLRIILQKKLPREVPEELCSRVQPLIDRITKANQEHILESYGDIEEGCFPPCITALIAAVASGANIPHTGRFAITAFLHTIGMHPAQIVEVFSRAPDFDLSRTVYQVEHISGRSGTEYTPPSCATMRTYGLCVNRDGWCEHVHHPLSYYRDRKKKELKKSEPSA